MKTHFKIFIALFIPLLFIGCSDDDIDPITQSNDLRLIDPGIININLNINTPDANAVLLTWDDFSDFSGDYSIQISDDSSFDNIIEVGSTSNNNFGINMAAMNAYANQFNFTPYLATTVYLRVVNSMMISNDISFTVKSYPQSGPVIITPDGGSNVVLNPETPDEEALMISWDEFAYMGTDATVNYVVQMALAGNNFENAVVLSNTSNTSISISHTDLNSYALALGIQENETGNVDLRVRSIVNALTGETLEFMSSTVSFSITTHESGIKYFYLVGEAVAAGWDPGNNNQPLFNDPNNPATAYLTGYFNPGGFKVVEELGSWAPQWGTNDGSTLAYNDGNGSDPDVFNIPEAGYYTFTFETDGSSGTFSITPFDASALPTWSTIGIIGDATPTGWDGDLDMTQSSFDPHQWYLNDVELNTGEMKFRADNDWNDNWGGSSFPFGQATGGGPNIPIDSGTYDIWFNDLTGRYTIILQ